MNKIEKMYCPNCGAPISFEEGREDTFCSHCGSQLHRDDDNIVRRLEHIEKKMEYAERHEERTFLNEKDKRDKVQYAIGIVALVVVLIAMMILFP